MAFEHYIQKGTQRLRMGFTTGSCAALAAKAATQLLLSDRAVDNVSILTPKGIPVTVDVLQPQVTDEYASCAVRKDGGDDPDITDGALVIARVSKNSLGCHTIDGGEGVGRITRQGLDQPVGAAAINSGPRRMILREIEAVCTQLGYDGGLDVLISIKNGEALAKKTFNPSLGITGGLSVLGTSGIEEPQSVQALVDCIEIELRAYAAEQKHCVILTPGNYGEAFLERHPFAKSVPTVKYANYLGEAIDFAIANGFTAILIVSHIGKLVKAAGGIFNTHSAVADCRTEIFTTHAALCGASRDMAIKLFNCVTADECIALLQQEGLFDAVAASISAQLHRHLSRRAGQGALIGAVGFSNKYGQLLQTQHTQQLIELFKEECAE